MTKSQSYTGEGHLLNPLILKLTKHEKNSDLAMLLSDFRVTSLDEYYILIFDYLPFGLI